MKSIPLSSFVDFAFTSGALSRERKVAQILTQLETETWIPFYQKFREIAQAYFENDQDANLLERECTNLREMAAREPQRQRVIEANIQAVQSLMSMGHISQLANANTISLNARRSQTISCEGLNLSVRPDFVFSKTIRGQEFVGGIKLFTSKENKLGNVWGKNLAVILQKYLESLNYNVRPDYCFAIDVFQCRKYKSSDCIESSLQKIQAECRDFLRYKRSIE
ncbi:MAG: hypothetical protein IJQ31_13050 [Thermoguttaceae bacterium]|nr:hypothetical protein [Thermoguttaceae bacterium]